MSIGAGSSLQNFAIANGNSSFTLSCTSTTSSVALPVAGTVNTDIELTNSGSVSAWVTVADSSSVSAVIPTSSSNANGYIILGGQTKVINIGVSQTSYIAGITSSSSAGTSIYGTMGKGS